MKTFIVHQPFALSLEVKDIKAMVVDANTAILLGNDFPATSPLFLSIVSLIGDPNTYLSDSICEMLHAEGLLSREPVLDETGKQAKLSDESLLWNYAWIQQASPNIWSLPKEQLALLAWDLHRHPNFVHVSVVNEEPEPAVTSPEEALDNAESEEYDDSPNDDLDTNI